MNEMGLAFYIASFLICVSCIVYTVIQNRNDKLQKKLYLFMLAFLAFNSITESIIQFVLKAKTNGNVSYYTIYVCEYLYYITHAALVSFLGYYVVVLTSKYINFRKIHYIIFGLPILVIEVILISNPITGWVFSLDKETLLHTREWGIIVLYIISAFYILFFIIRVLVSWKSMNIKKKIAMSYFLIMVIAGILIQAFFMKNRVELLSESLAFLGLLLTVEDEDDLVNNDVGIYNRKALGIDLDNLIANKNSFYVICIKVENSDIIRRLTGSVDTNILTDMVFKELMKIVSKYDIYQTSPDTFIILVYDKTKDIATKAFNLMSERFDKAFSYNNYEVMLDTTIMLAKLPNDLSSSDEVFNMADSTLPPDHKKRMIGKEDLSYLLRRKAVESALERAIRDGNFEVYYQPTFSVDTKSLFGAEALVRIKDKNITNLYPDEFIPLAEQIGLIGEIDDFVLNEVCSFIKSGIPKEYNLKSINVNLSVIQCSNYDFANHLIKIVSDSGVNKEYISFEITESLDSNAFESTNHVIKSLIDYGFKVYMDDYGTGYSNMHNLFSMDFNIIKIDKSILWGAFSSDLGLTILKNNIRMLKELNLKILVEGVETIEQIRLLEELGVDYLQGYYFSKPISKVDFIDFLKNNKWSNK